MNTYRCVATLLGSLLVVSANAVAAAELPPAAHTEAFATMRDQVRLAADVYLPEGEGPWPVILTRTPYLKDSGRWGEGAGRYTDAGYAYVVQDVRGKGNSEGFYIAYADDLHDGYDTVEWAARQPWSNGRVGVTGASAMGMTSNLAAAADPPHLQAAYVVVAPDSRFEYTFFNGVFKEADTGNWLRRQGVTEEVIDGLKARATWDAFWAVTDIKRLRRNIDIPMYHVGGWYDIFSSGAPSNFAYLQNHGRQGARGNQKLYMGPFGHGPLSGELAYPGADRSASAAEELRWFDHWLKDEDTGLMAEPPVRYYQMAAARQGEPSARNGFVAAPNWPPAAAATRYYLGDDKALTTRPPEDEGRYRYRFDPADPVPTVGGANLTFERGPMDQRAIGERRDYLRFVTPPLEAEVAVAGRVTVELWVATDALDTDFMVKLVDVYPDGYEALVLDAPISARYRHGRMPDDVALMRPDVPARLEIDLWSTALTFEPGHRIGLHVTSSNAPRFAVNPNTGSPAGSPAGATRVARNQVLYGGATPSALVLPVVYPD